MAPPGTMIAALLAWACIVSIGCGVEAAGLGSTRPGFGAVFAAHGGSRRRLQETSGPLPLPVLGFKQAAQRAQDLDADGSPPDSGLTGCMYTVKEGDTLHSIAKSMDVMLDEIQYRNDKDLTKVEDLKPGMVIETPCPGTEFYTYSPLFIAGCFFDYVIDDQHPSIWSIVKNPPSGIPGPFSITGIWTANYQALRDTDEPVDLTAPGAYVVGRRIFLPTCGHAGTLVDDIQVTPPTGCVIDLSSNKGKMPKTMKELADALQLPLSALVSDGTSGDKKLDASGSIPIPCLSPDIVAMAQNFVTASQGSPDGDGAEAKPTGGAATP
ncbi:hypothetical protein FOA52_010335 [Chlamydomonas sp. UWO 241]|nr:hypothetical protein FOA52_010335 [Chlamydomonas sp. UWO 241]